MNIVGAVILGIIILALMVLWAFFRERDGSSFDTGVFIGMILGLLVLIETALVADIIYGPRPSAIDVYRGNTELEITSINGIPTDTVVVFKKELK